VFWSVGFEPGAQHLYALESLYSSGAGISRVRGYRLDAASGTLTLLKKYPTGKGSNWVEIVRFD